MICLVLWDIKKCIAVGWETKVKGFSRKIPWAKIKIFHTHCLYIAPSTSSVKNRDFSINDIRMLYTTKLPNPIEIKPFGSCPTLKRLKPIAKHIYLY